MRVVVGPPSSPAAYEALSLTDAEVAEVARIRDRLARAVYAADSHVLIYWDTETTGLKQKPWWQADVIVQIAAVTAPGTTSINVL